MLALVGLKATVGLDVLPTLDRFARRAAAARPSRRRSAEPTVGGKWQDGVVRYFNGAPEHDWALQQAVAAWNGSGAHVRFEASTRQLAQLVIRSKDVEKCGHGHATLGFTPLARADIFRPGDGPGCDPFSAARVLAHELGHVLGLEHDDTRCAAMNSKGNRRGVGALRADPAVAVALPAARGTGRARGGKAVRRDARLPPPARQLLAVPPLSSRRAEIKYLPGALVADRVAFSFVRPADSVTPTFLTGFVLPVLHLRVRARSLRQAPREPALPLVGRAGHRAGRPVPGPRQGRALPPRLGGGSDGPAQRHRLDVAGERLLAGELGAGPFGFGPAPPVIPPSPTGRRGLRRRT